MIRDPSLDPILLEAEAKKLDETIGDYHHLAPTKLTPSRRPRGGGEARGSPAGRGASPSRLPPRVTAGMPAAGSSPPSSLRPYRSKVRK